VRLYVITDAEPIRPTVAFQRKASYEEDDQAATGRTLSAFTGGDAQAAVAQKIARKISLIPMAVLHFLHSLVLPSRLNATLCGVMNWWEILEKFVHDLQLVNQVSE
jgi:hypothetical protein